jgi:hypothetical protein
MEAKYKSLSIFEFQASFPDEDACYKHLAEMKWKDGFKCTKCNHTKSYQGIKKYDRQCSKCSHIESPMAGTLFHTYNIILMSTPIGIIEIR